MSKAMFQSAALMAICIFGICEPLLAASDQVHIIPASELDHWWQVDHASPNPPPSYPLDALKAGVQGCVAVAFEIDGDGKTSHQRVWRTSLTNVWPRKQVEAAALQDVQQWKFISAPANASRDPVYTYQVVTFTLTGSSTKWTKYDQERQDKIEAKCEMSDFPQQVQAMISAKPKPSPDKP